MALLLLGSNLTFFFQAGLVALGDVMIALHASFTLSKRVIESVSCSCAVLRLVFRNLYLYRFKKKILREEHTQRFGIILRPCPETELF